jgi:four helix bundle suffix protein
VANIAIILLRQADYLIYKYLQSVGERFLRQGGFREKLTSERLKKRTTQEEKLLKDNKGY